ncbi:hypothetical protein IPM62_03640 [Candidatus Woesebacteria bacterium]|nr:MAG: hypothetical protein IPM62_03640 [Candidatus Woesebacteria bacterium]
MKTIRYTLRLTYAFINKFKAVLFLSMLVGLILFIVVSTIAPQYFGRSSVRIGITGRYQSNELPPEILNEIGDGLTSLDSTGSAVPNLAQSWESQDNGKTWIFKIDTTKKWQDGSPVTSENISYEYSDVEIQRPDLETIVFKLDDAFSPFPTVVSRPTFRTGLLGTDLWKVEKVTVTGSFVSELIMKDKKGNQKIYRFFPTESGTKLAFKRGKIDKIVELFDPAPLKDWKTVEVKVNTNKDKVVTLFFNTKDKLFADKSIRQAFVYAINKDDFEGERAISPLSPDSWAFNSQVKKYQYDKERAKELLKEVPSELLSEEVKIVSTPFLLPLAEKISAQWNELGIKSIVQVTSVVPSEFQVYLTIFDIPDDPDQYPVWHSTQQLTNISKYENPRIDKLLEDGRLEVKREERKNIYYDFQRFLVEDMPAAFLYHPLTYELTRK